VLYQAEPGRRASNILLTTVMLDERISLIEDIRFHPDRFIRPFRNGYASFPRGSGVSRIGIRPFRDGYASFPRIITT